MNKHHLIFICFLSFGGFSGMAREVPQWRPDGTVAAWTQVGGKIQAWPSEDALLYRTAALKESHEDGYTWIEFSYAYFAFALSPRCQAWRARTLSNGLTPNQHLRAALGLAELLEELNRDRDCVRTGRAWIRGDRLRPWAPPRQLYAAGPKAKAADLDRGFDFLRFKYLTQEILGDDSTAPDLVLPHVGECIVTPKAWSKLKPRSGTGYDRHFAPHWSRRPATTVNLPSGRRLKNRDLRAIDAVARTLYGEVQGCQFDWIEDEYRPGHFEAVGRLIADRSEAVGTGTNYGTRDFGAPSERPIMEQVVSRKGQFNNWDLAIRNKRGRPIQLNGALFNSLCPRNQKNKQIFVGPSESFSKEHDEIWKWAVEIATQMYLNRPGYQQRYPWKVGGGSKHDLRVLYFTHGNAKPSSRFARFHPLPVEGVGPYHLEFAPKCAMLKTWKAVPRPAIW